jgi:suppressor of fused protein SUFU
MDATSPSDEDAAPGWDALDAAMAALYPGQQPRHVGYALPAALSNNLQGCSAYAACLHSHYVTYGLSERYEPDADADSEWSGRGFELTLRVLGDVHAEPPAWPFTVLNKLANHINAAEAPVAPGHRLDLGQPITGYPHTDGPETGLTVFAATTRSNCFLSW